MKLRMSFKTPTHIYCIKLVTNLNQQKMQISRSMQQKKKELIFPNWRMVEADTLTNMNERKPCQI